MNTFKETLFMVVLFIVGIVIVAAIGSIGGGDFLRQFKGAAIGLPTAVFSVFFGMFSGAFITGKWIDNDAKVIGAVVGFFVGLFVILPIAVATINNLFFK